MQRVWFYKANFNKMAVERQVKVEASRGDLVWLRGLSCLLYRDWGQHPLLLLTSSFDYCQNISAQYHQ